MAIKLTSALRDQIKASNPQPTLVMKIDGYGLLICNLTIQKKIKIGDTGLIVGGGWLIDGLSDRTDINNIMLMDKGSTTKITQKLDPSKGTGSSVTQMNFSLIDVFESITNLISPGKVLTDILGRRVTIMSGCRDTAFPEDYNIVFRGIIRAVRATANTVQLMCSSTDEKKRIALLPPRSTNTTAVCQYRSAQVQDILYKNREDLVNLVAVTYSGGGTAGSEVVTLLSTYSINVQIQNGVSTAAQIKKVIENSALSNQLVDVKINGNSSNTQVTGTYSLGSDAIISGDFSSFYAPVDALSTWVKIEDEILDYTGKSTTQLTGVSRAMDGSLGSFHATAIQTEQIARLQGNGITLALKLMLSGGDTYYLSSYPVYSFVFYSLTTLVTNAIFLGSYDLIQEYGLAVGDLVTVTGDPNAANNVTDAVIQEIGVTGDGKSYILINQTLVSSSGSAAIIKFKSQFNTLPFGMAMKPSEVDVEQHLFVRDTFLPLFDLDIRVDRIDDGKAFLDEEIYQPMACYSVPRQGRSSIVHTTAPLPNYEVIDLNLTSVENPASLAVERSTTENFINQIQYDYDYNIATDKYLSHKNFPETIDRSVIDLGAKPLIIKSRGLRSSINALTAITNMSDRYLRRYQNGAEFIKNVQVSFSYGYQLEIGDIVAVDFAALKLSDFSTGTRAGGIKLMEVVNKSIDFKTLAISIDILSTIFQAFQRYGVISPSSLTDVGSTVGKIMLKKSWSTQSYQRESSKWRDYIGQSIVVRKDDFTTSYSTVIRGFDNLDPQGMSIDPIAGLAGTDWIVEPISYPSSTDSRVERYWKSRHAFFSPQVLVAAGTSITQFTVAAPDAAKFFANAYVRVHNYDYTNDSGDVQILSVTGTTIVVKTTLGFIPNSTHYIDLIGFPDQGQAYRIT